MVNWKYFNKWIKNIKVLSEIAKKFKINKSISFIISGIKINQLLCHGIKLDLF